MTRPPEKAPPSSPSSGHEDVAQYTRSLIEASLDPLVTISAQGKITDVNQATVEATGVARQALIGTDFSDYFTEPDKARQGYQQVFAEGVVTNYPLTLRHRNGHLSDVLYNASVYRDPAGRVLGVFAAARDITELNKAQAEVVQLSQRNQLILNAAGEGIYGLDPEGRCTFVNPAAAQLLGFGVDEILGQKTHPLFHHTTADGHPYPESECPVQEAYIQGVVHRGNDVYWRKDGSSFQVGFVSTPIQEGGHTTGAVVVFRDITAIQRAQEELQRSERSLAEAQRIAHLGSWHVDLATTEVYWSQVLYEMYGFDPALPPPLLTESQKLFTPESWARLSASIARAVETGTPYEIELEMVKTGGDHGWMLARGELVRDAGGNPSRVQGVVMDITTRKQAEEEVRSSERSLAEAQRMAHLGNWSLDLIHNVLTWSDEIYRIFEIDPKQFGASYEAFLHGIHPDDRDRVNNAYTESVANHTPYNIVHRLLMNDGRVKYVNERCKTYYDDEGKPLRSVGTVHDITEQVVAENAIKQLNRDLERRVAQRTQELQEANAELESFAYSVSHDLRVPLRAIDGFSQIVLEEYATTLDAEGQRLLNVVRDNTQRMAQLIDDILSFSRTGRQEMRLGAIDMAALVRGTLAELAPNMADRQVEVEIQPLPSAHADRAMMERVFVNLLTNAIKFTAPKAQAHIVVGATPGEGETIYFVRDNGVGFDMRYADKLFGVFQRLHSIEEFEGTGIGLAIVKRVVTRHGGRVWAEGRVGEGATIYFTLPIEETHHE